MRRMNGCSGCQDRDFLAAEEPLEIRVEGHSVAVVMRTPGEDRELVAGDTPAAIRRVVERLVLGI